MNVSMEKTGNVSAVLTVAIEENDYKEKVEKELKAIGRTRAIPGFRQGHVPFGELNRRFGKHVASDVINNEVYNAVVKYIQENKLGVLGQPIPVEVVELDLKNQKDFTFQYELALTPELNVELDKNVVVPYYKINVTDEMIAEERRLIAENESIMEEYRNRLAGKEFWAHFDELTANALEGDPSAQNALGEMYYYGDEIERDYEQAVFWFKEAAKQKHPDGMYNLGMCFVNGEGIERNEATGQSFIRQAAKLGSKAALAASGDKPVKSDKASGAKSDKTKLTKTLAK